MKKYQLIPDKRFLPVYAKVSSHREGCIRSMEMREGLGIILRAFEPFFLRMLWKIINQPKLNTF